MQRELDRFTNQARFIKMIIDRELIISKKKKAVLIAELKRLDFKPFAKVEDATKDGETAPVVEDDAEHDDDVALASSSYDYLLGVCALTFKEHVHHLTDST
jgi:DNA topoisomerase II